MLSRNRARPIQTAALLWAAIAGAPASAARRVPEEAALPQAAVVTNLRSPTGRTVYLLLRPEPVQVEGLRPRAERMAKVVSAKLRLRAAGDLWVAVLEHEIRGLDVHRHGRDLRLAEGPVGALDEVLAAGVRLPSGRPDSDIDQEILLKARSVMRDREVVSPSLVALAQAAAARQVLLRYVANDDLGAALWGQRYMPLLMQHPDAALLKEVVSAAWDALTVPPPSPSPHLAADAPPIGAWTQAIAAASKVADRARRHLHELPNEAQKTVPAEEKED